MILPANDDAGLPRSSMSILLMTRSHSSEWLPSEDPSEHLVLHSYSQSESYGVSEIPNDLHRH